MNKPAFAFDGRNVLPHAQLRAIGFEVHGIGKPPARLGTGVREDDRGVVAPRVSALSSRRVTAG
jgi:hypothetical protein